MISALSMLLLAPTAGQTLVGCNFADETKWDKDCADQIWWIDDVRSGPAIAGRPTLMVRYDDTHATGMSQQSMSLMQRRGPASYRVLWTHKFLDISNNLRAQNFRIRYHWRFDPRRVRIIVTGTKSLGGSYDLDTGLGRARSIRRLPTDVYCWSPRFETFVRC